MTSWLVLNAVKLLKVAILAGLSALTPTDRIETPPTVVVINASRPVQEVVLDQHVVLDSEQIAKGFGIAVHELGRMAGDIEQVSIRMDRIVLGTESAEISVETSALPALARLGVRFLPEPVLPRAPR